MKRAAILLAAMACVAAAPNDHAIIERAFAGGRNVQFEHDLYGGKAAVYRPVTLDARVASVAGERCESRFSAGWMTRVVNWAEVRRIELGEAGGEALIWITSGERNSTTKMAVRFASREEATPVVLAMERLQVACRPKGAPLWP